MPKIYILLAKSICTFLLVVSGVLLPHSPDTVLTNLVSGGVAGPRDGYGIYESCDPHLGNFCGSRLNNIAAGGFSEVMNYSTFSADTTIDDVMDYAEYANQLGLKLIWPIDDFTYSTDSATDVLRRYPLLVQSINSSGLCHHSVTTNYWLVACITTITSDNRGTWGYYIGDELPASSEPKVRHIVDTILDWDPAAWRMFTAQDVGGYLNSSQVHAYGRVYRDGSHDAADANVIAQDYYPIGTSQQAQAAATTGHVAAALNSFATGEHTSFGIALQAQSLSQYKSVYSWCKSVAACPYPTASQEQSMLSAVLAHGDPQIVMWYSYFDLLNSHNYAKHWTDLTTVVGGVPAPSTTTMPTLAHCLLEFSAVRWLPEQDALRCVR